MPLKPASGRLPSLDGWRAVAITLVILSHFSYARGFPGPAWWTIVANLGDLGVRVFFVLSGFLITYLLLVEAAARGRPSLRSFYTRRVLRIFPVYFLYAGVVALLVAAGLYTEARSSWIGTLTFTRNVLGRGDSVTIAFWSLAVEEQFYLVWPLTFVGLALWRRPRLAIGLLLIPLAVCPLVRAELIQAHWHQGWVVQILGGFSIARYADSLAVGCVGAFLYRAYGARLRRLASPWLLAGATAVFVAGAAGDFHIGGWFSVVVPPVEAIALACAIWVTLDGRPGPVYRLLNSPVVAWLGVLSYSLYVWQELFLSHFAGPKLSRLPVYDWRIWWLAALACACASYYVVERPILRARDRMRRQTLATAATESYSPSTP